MKRSLICALCLWVGVAFLPNLAAGENAEYVMKVAIGNPVQDYYHGWSPFLVFKNEVEKLSNGRLKVELHPLTLGKSSAEMLAEVREGVVQARDFADGHFALLYPPIQVLSIPYLFAEREIAWHVLDGPFGQSLIDDMAKKTGLRPLSWSENGGFRHYSNSQRIVRSPADMKGLKIRTMEIPLHMKIVTDLGGRAVPVVWAETYDALEAGVVDGQENSISTFLLPKFEKIQKFIVLDGHVYSTYTLLMNEAWYQTLPADLKRIINIAKKISLVVNRGLSVTNEIMGFEYLETQGVEIYKPTQEEKSQFKKMTQKSAIEWLKKNIDSKWVDGALKAASQAEQELGY